MAGSAGSASVNASGAAEGLGRGVGGTGVSVERRTCGEAVGVWGVMAAKGDGDVVAVAGTGVAGGAGVGGSRVAGAVL